MGNQRFSFFLFSFCFFPPNFLITLKEIVALSTALCQTWVSCLKSAVTAGFYNVLLEFGLRLPGLYFHLISNPSPFSHISSALPPLIPFVLFFLQHFVLDSHSIDWAVISCRGLVWSLILVSEQSHIPERILGLCTSWCFPLLIHKEESLIRESAVGTVGQEPECRCH